MIRSGGRQEKVMPSGEEIDRLRRTLNPKGKPRTWASIGEQYGVSRQAAHKAWKSWRSKKAQAVIDAKRKSDENGGEAAAMREDEHGDVHE